MQCPRCHAENREGRRFCGECGLSFASACPSCGFLNEGSEKFCGGCGRALAAAPTPAEPRFTLPHSYTPKHLAEKILTSKSALEGERKQVTVLFADLKGSMELLADRDPEEARKILDPVLERMMEAVHRYEGTVNQVMGDGIMALFGAPVAHEDHAVRACYAALRMQESVKRYGEEARHAHGVNVQIRVGLNSGEVVVRSIGSDLRMDYTAVGQTTHLAARMEQLAPPGSTQLTASTLRLAEGYIEVKPLGTAPVKGLEAPVELYELVGAGPRRSRVHAAAARDLTRLVGRETELEQLRQVLSRAAAGHGQVVAIVGEPGVGKSRLVWEVTHSPRTHKWMILQAGSASYGKATPYLPAIDLLRAYFGIGDRDDQRTVCEKVSGKLLTLDEGLKSTLPALLALLDMPVEDTQWQTLDPPQRRQRTLAALKRVLLRESQVQPLLVVFEDLQWIDSETQALLESLVESLPTARVLLLVNHRPEYQHGWSGKTYYTLMRLDPLPPENAEELLQALVGTDGGLQPVKTLLIEQTEGNPFFLEESVLTLVETNVLAGERGDYRLAKALRSVQVPATVQAVLASRMDRLPPEEKRLLQSASVIGKDVSFVLLQAVAELPEADLRQTLTDLQAAEFIYETRLFPDQEYTFKHALTQEVAFASLLGERRRTLDARIVDAIEGLYSDRLAEYAELLGHHASRGELWEKAVRYLRQAGVKAASRSAYREAGTCFEQALNALGRLPESRETLEEAVDLRYDLRNALLPLADHAAIFGHLDAAEALARRLGDDQRLGRIACYRCLSFSAIQDHEQAIAAGHRALSTAAGVFDVEVVAQTYLGMAYYAIGDFRQALNFSRKARAPLTRERSYERFGQVNLPAVSSGVHVAWSLAELGDFAEGGCVAEETVRLAETTEQRYSIAAALRAAGLLYRRQGELPRAIVALERALELCQSADIQIFFPQIASTLGAAYALAGRMAEAMPLLDQMLKRVVTGTRFITVALVLAELTEALLLIGRAAEASALAGRLLEISRAHTGRGYQAHAHRLLGDLATRKEPLEPQGTESHYREAIALAGELGMRPLVAHCYLGLGKLYRRTGKREQAREHLTTATTMYREMGMTYWLEKAEVELQALA